MNNVNEIKQGLKVRVIRDDGTKGMMIAKKHLSIREVGKEGTVLNWIPGHGGDVWFVQQDNGIAAYCYTELEADGGYCPHCKVNGIYDGCCINCGVPAATLSGLYNCEVCGEEKCSQPGICDNCLAEPTESEIKSWGAA